MSQLYDITIVGGGPVGLFAAFYDHLYEAKVQIIDSVPQLGGQPAILYPEKEILDVPGFPNLTGEELTNRLIEQLNGFDTPIHLNETVLEIDKQEEFAITTSKGSHLTKTVIIAMGGGAFKPRPLELEGVEGYENIHYHVSNIQQYTGKKVTILGGETRLWIGLWLLKKSHQLPLFTAEIISVPWNTVFKPCKNHL